MSTIAKTYDSTREIRKLQMSGGSTYVISLPKVWIDQLGLKTGDNVAVVKNVNNSLTIFNSDGEDQQRSTGTMYITQRESFDSLKRKIIAMYIAGYKKIVVKSKGVRIDPKKKQAIRSLVRSNMIGTEIVESSSESITIQILTRTSDLSLEVAMKRMYLITSSMHKEAVEMFCNKEVEREEDVTSMDDDVDRLALYLVRNLNLAVKNQSMLQEIGLADASDCLGFQIVVRCIERIADHASLIAKRTKFIDGKIDPDLLEQIKKLDESAIRVFTDSVTALSTRNYSLAESVAEQAAGVVDNEKYIMGNIHDTKKYTSAVRFVLEDIRRTAEYSTDISEVVINGTIANIVSTE